VPSVVGLDQASATTQLENAGFKVAVEQSYADDGVGTVVSCSPAPGKRAEPADGATITVAVARTIPQVTGEQMDAAEQALRALGASNIHIQSVSSDEESGTVVGVSPEEGAQFKAADEITLSVATPYVVPTVSGLTVDAAKAAVEKAGLTAKVEYVASDKAKNTVVESSPAAGTQAKEGDTVKAAVRGEYFEFCAPETEGANPFHLEKKIFTGLSWKLIGTLGTQPLDISALGTHAGTLSEGDDLFVRIRPENVVYYNNN